MKRNYRVVTAFMLTLLLVFGSFGMAYADTKVNVHLNDTDNDVKSNITAMELILNDGTEIPLSKQNNNLYKAPDGGTYVTPSISAIRVYFGDENYWDYDGDLGTEANGTLNIWLNILGSDVASIKVTKTVNPKTANPGDQIEYKFKVENTGLIPLSSIVLNDPLLAGVTGWDTNSNIGSLAPGASIEVTQAYTIAADYSSTTLDNTVTVTGQYGNNKTVSDTDTESVSINKTPPATTSASIDVEKSVNPGSVNAGESVNYTITVTNDGTETLNEVVLSDPMFNGATHGGVYWPVQIGTLAPNGSQTYTVNLNAPTESSGSISNTVWANACYNDNPLTASDTAIFTIKTQGGGGDDHDPGLELIKTVDKTTTGAMNAQATYTFTVKNTGNVELTNVYLEDGDIGFYTTFASIAVGATVTTEKAVTLNSELFEEGVFLNIATASTVYEEETVSDDSNATVTYINPQDPQPEPIFVKFFVLIDGNRPTAEGSQPTTSFTGILGTLQITDPGVTLSPGSSLINEFPSTETALDVENKAKELGSQSAYDALMTVINNKMIADYSTYLPTGSWHIDWYDFKWESDGWHIDGDLVVAIVPDNPPGGGGSGGGSSSGGSTVIVPDDPTPAGPAPDPEVSVIEEEIPAGPLPQTGGIPALALYGIGALLAAAGTGMKLRKKD